MKQVINGKTYNTENMTVLVSVSRYNNGTFAGSDSIRVTKSGAYCFVATSNGQDLYREAFIEAIDPTEVAAKIEGWTLDDAEQLALIERGLITEA